MTKKRKQISTCSTPPAVGVFVPDRSTNRRCRGLVEWQSVVHRTAILPLLAAELPACGTNPPMYHLDPHLTCRLTQSLSVGVRRGNMGVVDINALHFAWNRYGGSDQIFNDPSGLSLRP